jgi:hypothetical protein
LEAKAKAAKLGGWRFETAATPAPAQTKPATPAPATPKATQPASPVPAATAGGFLASIGKKVFHKPDCKSVPTIPPENLVKFGTREEATAAGKKPCAICKP